MFRGTRHIHLVAIGGIGMSGIAEVLLNQGFTVSGSDVRRTAITQRLEKLGATIHLGHDPANIDGADVVVRSSAVTNANSEVAAARQRRVPVIRRAEMLAELMRLKEGVAIAGSHGKTSTTTLAAAVFAAGGLDPTVIVGGQIKAMGTNAILGGGDYLIAEADESDGSFLHLTPTLAVVTNIDYEHVDFYPDMDSLRGAFQAFLQQVPFYGTCVMCADDPEVRGLLLTLDRRAVTYGLEAGAEITIDPSRWQDDGLTQTAVVVRDGKDLGPVTLSMPGRHNLLNALAAVAVGLDVGIPFAKIAEGLAACQGVGRRCESHGEHDGVLVLDDYGHHPTEIQATMDVARKLGRPLTVVFQPHRFSRTAMFAREFADALVGADAVALLPVYAAGETPPAGVDSDLIARYLKDRDMHAVDVVQPGADLAAWLATTAQPGGLLLTLGAGDVGGMVAGFCDLLDERGRA